MRWERRGRSQNFVEIGDMLGMKGSSSGHGPHMWPIMFLVQSQRSVVIVASWEVGGMREIAVAPKVACLSSRARSVLTSNLKDRIILPSEPID